jgi:hypothetical protein
VAVDFGEGGGLLAGIAAVAADGLADDVAVFLFHKTIVVFPVGPAAGKLNAVFPAPLPNLVIDELPSAVAVHALEGKGRELLMSMRLCLTLLWARLRASRSSTQPEETSVRFTVLQNSPELLAPQ